MAAAAKRWIGIYYALDQSAGERGALGRERERAKKGVLLLGELGTGEGRGGGAGTTGVDMEGMAGGGGGTDDRWIAYLYPARSERLTGVAGMARANPTKADQQSSRQAGAKTGENGEKW